MEPLEGRKWGVVIGRFQLPHKAHFDLIRTALEQCDKVIIGIGSANVRRSLRNPFSYEQRMSLIQAGSNIVNDAIRNQRLYFVPLEDSVYSDQWWVEHVQRQVKEKIWQLSPEDAHLYKNGDKPDITLIGHKKDDTSYYLDMFPQWKFHGIEATNLISSTECREAYYEFGLDDKTFQNKLINYTTPGVKEGLRYIPIQVYQTLKDRWDFVKAYKEEWGEGPHYTADAVVIKSGHILLIKRGQEPDIGAWAFPGGFKNEKENSLETAKRECLEETGLDLSQHKHKKLIFSDYSKPFRDDRGDVRTTAYMLDLGFGELPEVKGQDDAAHAEWVPVADLRADNMFADHYFIFRDLIRKV